MIEFIKEIKKVLDNFEKNNVRYVISRNYGFLLENKIYDGKDIDLCVERKDVAKIKKIFENFNFKRIPINPFSNHLGYHKFFVKEKKRLFFHIHVDGITGSNLRYLDSKNILKHKRKIGFFYVSSFNDELLIILLHSILDKKRFRKDYIDDIERLKKENINWDYIEKILNKKIGRKYSIFVINNIKKHRYELIEKEARNIYNYFIKNYPFKLYWIFRLYFFGGLWKLNWFRKSKPLIAFIGMDGSGKTTTSNNFIQVLKKNNFKVKRIYTGRGRNNILPIHFFGKRYKKIGGKTSLGAEGKGRKKFSIIHTLAAPVFAFDLLLRYFFKIFPARKTHDFVITDRYTTDVLLTNKVPMFLKRFLFWFFPKPTITFYLYNDPQILFVRKKDHPIEDLYRQEKIFDKINKIVKPVKIKSEGEDNTLDDVLNYVNKLL